MDENDKIMASWVVKFGVTYKHLIGSLYALNCVWFYHLEIQNWLLMELNCDFLYHSVINIDELRFHLSLFLQLSRMASQKLVGGLPYIFIFPLIIYFLLY